MFIYDISAMVIYHTSTMVIYGLFSLAVSFSTRVLNLLAYWKFMVLGGIMVVFTLITIVCCVIRGKEMAIKR